MDLTAPCYPRLDRRKAVSLRNIYYRSTLLDYHKLAKRQFSDLFLGIYCGKIEGIKIEITMTKNQAFDEAMDNIEAVHKRQVDAFEAGAKERREKAEIKENIRIKRVAANGGNKLDYALKEIIMQEILHRDTFVVNLNSLGFSETSDDMGNATAFLNLLKNNKCFESFDRLGNDSFQINKPDKFRLEAYKEKMSGTERKTKQRKVEIKPLEIAKEYRPNWNDIALKFVNDFDVQLYVRGKFIGKYSHEHLYFYKGNTKDKKVDVQWEFLRRISAAKGKFDLNRDIEFGNKSIQQKTTIKEQYRAIISKLSRHLKKLFDREDIPFNCDEEKYQTNFKLEPIPALRDDGEIFIPGREILDETSEYYEDQIANKQNGTGHQKNRKNDF